MIKDSSTQPFTQKKVINGTVTTVHSEGLTKYEHFLALAVQGILANSTNLKPRDIAERAINVTDEVFNAVNYWPEELED